MSISLIIPAFNYAQYLPRTLRSVLAQETAIPLEIIVVDDGSTDNTADVARAFGNRIQYIHQHNQGLSAARNTGMAHATGEALVFLDADDLLLPDTLESQWRALEATPQASISICRNYIFTAQEPEGPLTVVSFFPLFGGAYATHMCCANLAPPHTYMLRRSLALNVGLFDPSLRACEDYDFWLRCLMAGGEIVTNPNTAVLYRRHAQSMSAQTGNHTAYEAICNRRLAHMLATTPTFQPERRLDVYAAHAFGSLNRAYNLLNIHEDMVSPLIAQCLDAIIEMQNIYSLSDTTAPIDSIATQIRRTEYEILTLQYYVFRTLLLLHIFHWTSPSLIRSAQKQLLDMFPQWNIPIKKIEHLASLMPKALHMPQELHTVADVNGLVHIAV